MLRTNSSNIFLKKQFWLTELKKTRQKIKTIGDADTRLSLEILANTIDTMIPQHKGDLQEAATIASLLSDLNQRTIEISAWEKQIAILDDKIRNMESKANNTYAINVSFIQKKMRAYKGDEPSKLEINGEIIQLQAIIDTAQLHGNVTTQENPYDQIELEEIGNNITPVKPPSSKGFSIFSLFPCCCGGDDVSSVDEHETLTTSATVKRYVS